MQWISYSESQTRRLGARLAQRLKPGDVLALIGQIGSGKTIFVQGLAQGLRIPLSSVASPSFVLVREYKGKIPLYHADLFRLGGLTEAASIGFEEYYDSRGVTVIEWANRIPEILPEDFLEVRFEVVDRKTRRLTSIAHGVRYAQRWGQTPG